jgi:hypothetical protein
VRFTVSGRSAADAALEVFPRYLEACDPAKVAASSTPLGWLDGLDREALPLRRAADGAVHAAYTPPAPGNYIARLRGADGDLYRYFAAIDERYVVYRALALDEHPPPGYPTGFRNAGVPIDWVSPPPGHAAVPHLAAYQRTYGDGVLPYLRVDASRPRDEAAYARLLAARLAEHAAAGFPFEGCLTLRQPTNAAVRAARRLGVDVLDAYTPNNPATLGAPTFPFYLADDDFRRAGRRRPGAAVGNTLDFVATYHFLGPVDVHIIASGNDRRVAAAHVDLAAREAVLAARNSGVHLFATFLVTLEDWVTRSLATHPHLCPIDPPTGPALEAWVTEFMHACTVLLPRRYPIVFARLVDYAAYFRAHHPVMPTRIVSYTTHTPAYDRHWTPEWWREGYAGVLAEPLPVSQDLSELRAARVFPEWGSPRAPEQIWFQSQELHCRFERACPKPVRYFRLDGGPAVPDGVTMPEVCVPDPRLRIATTVEAGRFEVAFTLSGGQRFPDYMLAVWDIPRELADGPVATNARECRLVTNLDGDRRALLRFDLEPETNVWLRLGAPPAGAA